MSVVSPTILIEFLFFLFSLDFCFFFVPSRYRAWSFKLMIVTSQAPPGPTVTVTVTVEPSPGGDRDASNSVWHDRKHRL
jgi:hypothetical protein